MMNPQRESSVNLVKLTIFWCWTNEKKYYLEGLKDILSELPLTCFGNTFILHMKQVHGTLWLPRSCSYFSVSCIYMKMCPRHALLAFSVTHGSCHKRSWLDCSKDMSLHFSRYVITLPYSTVFNWIPVCIGVDSSEVHAQMGENETRLVNNVNLRWSFEACRCS